MKAVAQAAVAVLAALASSLASQQPARWNHLSWATGDLPSPFSRTPAGSLVNGNYGSPSVDIFIDQGSGKQ